MIYLKHLHDLTIKIENNFIELDKVTRIKKFNNFEFNEIKNENILIIDNIKKKLSNGNKSFLNKQKYGIFLSHHELHAYSVIQFIKKNNIEINEIYILVNDGNGTIFLNNEIPMAECISLYYYNFKEKRIKNLFSYLHNIKASLLKNYSPSMLYFFTCNNIGLEYGEEGKILALESKVKEFNSIDKINKVHKLINVLFKIFINNFHKNLIENFKTSSKIKIKKSEELERIIENIFFNTKPFKENIFDNKYIKSYALQLLYEKIMIYIIRYSVDKYKIKTLGGTGGGFFNVKLNNLILNQIEEKLIINPVPGDLGINYFRNKKETINAYQNRYLLNRRMNAFIKND